MKKTFYLYCALSLAICGCDKEDSGPGQPMIDIPASMTNFPAFTGEKTVTFTTTNDWKIEINETKSSAWCSVEPTQGKAGEATVRVSAQPNDTYEDRTAEIVIKAGSATRTITVSQPKKNVLNVTQKTYDDFSGLGGELKIEVAANLDYDIIVPDEDKEWIIRQPSKALGSETLVFEIVASDQSESRTGKVIVKDKNSEQADTAYITQLPKGTVHIDLATAGTLKEYELDGITTLILTGEPNANDFTTLKEQAPGLEKLDMSGSTITVIPAYAFDRVNASKSLRQIVLPPALTAIEEWAFSTSGITSIEFPETLVSIGSGAFAGSAIEEANLPASVKSIGANAFISSNLRRISLPEGVTIEESAFAICGLTSVTIPPNTVLSSKTFWDCPVLKEITFSENIAYTGKFVCMGCTALETVVIKGSNTAIGEAAFSGCNSLKTVNMENGSGKIERGAFAGCTTLESIVIGNGPSEIESMTFSGCKALKSVTLPPSVTVLGSQTFEGCSVLTSVRCEAVNPPQWPGYVSLIQIIGFDIKSAVLHVPAASKTHYQNAEGWKDFGEIAEF